MPPKGSRAKTAVEVPPSETTLGGPDAASKQTTTGKSDIEKNLPSEAEVIAGSSGLSIEDKLKALATVVPDDTFIEDDSDEELEIDHEKGSASHLRSTAILLFPVIPEEWLCTQASCGKAHGKSFMTAADHITFASHLLGLEKLGAATRLSLEKLNLNTIRKEQGLSLHNILIHPSGRLIKADVQLDAFHITLVAVYFPADVTDRKSFIRRVLGPVVDGVPPGAHLLVLGDLNLVEDPLLDRTSRKGTTKENDELYQRCSAVRLSDAFRVLHPFKREFTFYSHACQTSSRIDRALISQSLLLHVEFASHIMPADPISDHSFAIKVAFRMSTQVQTGPGLWRLPAYMVGRPGVRKVIERVSNQMEESGGNYELLIARLNAGLKAYAREESKRVRATLSFLHQAVADLKQAWLGDPSCVRLKDLLSERELQLRSYQQSRQERLHVMAGMKEVTLGEVASPFLSAKIKGRKARTQITELNVGGTMVSDNKSILDAASQYYRQLFGADRQTVLSEWEPSADRRMSSAVAESLTAEWSEEEVKRAFQSMTKNKAPGRDGLPKELFEAHWDILGKHFMLLVKSFSDTASLPTSTKDAVTILLHKKGGRDQLENYRPITLLSFTYKVIARVVADRMKKALSEVVSPEQFGFLPGRRLSDAVGLVADIIEAAKNKDKDWYLLLVDFRKAFDSVSRGFLFTVLEKMGFPPRFVGWIRGLHENTRTSLLVNGWIGEAVDVVSGVRQGCPLAPYLFLCAVEPLAQEAVNRRIGVSEGDQRLAYLGYANDTTLILEGEVQIAEAEKLLEEFAGESGLATNKEKSVVLPLGSNLGRQPWKTDGFKWAKADEAERLLGVWVTPAGSCNPTWEKAFAQIKRKLSQWEAQHLTTGARAAVINCYVSPIIFFQAQVYPPPMDIWGRILKLTHNFMSGNRASTDKEFILWSRELLYMAREEGGVGVKDPEIALTCLIARKIGLLLTETNALKRDIMLQAADLPLGTDTFVAHVKLLKCWRGKSERWKLACANFMQSPLASTSLELSREEAAKERIVFNRHILMNGMTPVGSQKAAGKLWEVRLGNLLVAGEDGGWCVKDVKTLARELGGSKQAKLALRAWEAAPQSWKLLLLSAEQSCAPTTQLRTPLQRTAAFSGGGIPSLKELKGNWQQSKHQSAKRELWAGRWAGAIAWKRVVKIRDSPVTPNRPRDVLLRIHSLNLQVGERLSFLSGKPVCPHCGEFETLEHCLYTCPRIQTVVGAVRKALRMLNPTRHVDSLGDLLFGNTASTSAFPEASLSAIAIHQIWAERCDCVFRGKRFRARRVLRRIEAAFRLHVRVYTRATGIKLNMKGDLRQGGKTYALAEQEGRLLGRVRSLNGKGWKWSHRFGALWNLARGALHPP
ncbi:unnamed protein product [Closterium sp. NIES-65]|nr:unnamed protein product [Closterium sp. NIES-65]